MNNISHVSIGIMIGLTLLASGYVNAAMGVVVLLLTVLLMVALFVFGRQIPLCVRVVFVVLLIDWGFSACLGGRTMAPRLSLYTFSMSVASFCILALIPAGAVFRGWALKVSLPIFILLFPVCMILAGFVATYEERQFIKDHPDGIGVTARWTASDSWLAYDAETGELTGGD